MKRINVKFAAVLVGTLTGCAMLQAQEVWSFDRCVEWARAHNISLQQSRLGEDMSAAELEAAEARWQPSLDLPLPTVIPILHGVTTKTAIPVITD